MDGLLGGIRQGFRQSSDDPGSIPARPRISPINPRRALFNPFRVHIHRTERSAIPINDGATEVLHRRWGQHPAFVFTYAGHPIKRPDILTWQRACKIAGITDFRWHDLRHTRASWLAQAGVDPQHLKTLGGWSTLAMVERYSHLNVEHLRAAADRIPTTFSLQSEIIDFDAAKQRRVNH